MPEQITKYPDVTLKVLKGGGARCGEGVKPKILTKCPPERFCALPGGELCVYGIPEIPQMTQISQQELARVVCPPGRASQAGWPGAPGLESAILLGAIFLAGLALGRFRRRGRNQEACGLHLYKSVR